LAKRLSRAVEQHARKLERAAADESAEPAARVWPNANHWISNGEDSRRYEEVHGWLARWLGTTDKATN
jgi:hypothetical protein